MRAESGLKSPLRMVVCSSFLLMVGLISVQPTQAVAASIVVTTTSDITDANDGVTSLREAIATANSNGAADDITFDATVFGGTRQEIALSQSLTLTASESLTIVAPAKGVTISSKPLVVNPGATATLDGLTITQSGINNSGMLTVSNSTLFSNRNDTGGGINNSGTLTVLNSTLSQNTGGFSGGGIFNSGTLTITNSTFNANISIGGGGGNINNSGSLTVNNSLFVDTESNFGFSSPGINGDANGNFSFASLAAAGLNSTGLAENGGRTQTIALLATSPVINKGKNGLVGDLTTDQRGAGFPRVVDSIVDVGAFEFKRPSTAPIVMTRAATGITSTSATLNATINPSGLATTAKFQSGTTVNYGTDSPVTLSPNDNTTGQDVSVTLTGLTPATTYNFRASATNSLGTTDGNNVTFTTLEMPSLVVTTTSDNSTNTDGLTSLREAIAYANEVVRRDDAITFDPTVFASKQTITLRGTQLGLNSADRVGKLSITGPASGVIINGDNKNRVFTLGGSANVTFTGLTISGGRNTEGNLPNGGGVLVERNAILVVRDCTISGNTAGSGGGIYNAGTTTLLNSTIADNGAISGGGIYNEDTLRAVNTTIASSRGGGGVSNQGTFNLSNSIIANNGSSNVIGTQPVGSNNITADGTTLANVGLDTMGLKDNGGPTNTIALLSKGTSFDATNTGSNTVANNNNLTTDQRGSARIVGGAVDIGAYESSVINTAPVFSAASYTAGLNDPLSIQLSATDADNDALTYTSANLPAGITLSAAGLLGGQPTSAGNFTFQVTVNDGHGGTATANIFIAVRDVPAGSDTLGPVLTHNVLPQSLTRDQLASFTVSGTVQDVAPAGASVAGVRRVLVQLRTGDNKQSYNGSAFTSNLNLGYYVATQSAGNSGDVLNYSRSLSFVPANLAPGNYILLLYPQDKAGNYSAEFLQFAVVAPSMSRFAPLLGNSGGSS